MQLTKSTREPEARYDTTSSGNVSFYALASCKA